MLCCFLTCLQGTVSVPNSYSIVSTGQELIDQLGNVSARHIRIANDLKVPTVSSDQVAVNRYVPLAVLDVHDI